MIEVKEKMKQYRRSGDYIVHVESIIFYECSKCNTRYPVLHGVMCCNGKAIKDCPYCYPNAG